MTFRGAVQSPREVTEKGFSVSRTDKTRPHWVKTLDPNETDRYVKHDHTPTRIYERGHKNRTFRFIGYDDGACDFDPKTSTSYFRGGENRFDRRQRCGWDLPYYYSWGHSYFRSPKFDERHHFYYSKERAAVRSSNREMMRDWNANGDDFDDDIAVVRQHRHACWGGGWWD